LHDNGVAEVVLNRPPVNALNAAGWNALAVEIAALGERPEVRVIVIRAEGRGFCAGVDIKELNADQSLIVAVNAGNYATFKAVHLNKVPVIAAVHGFVLGGGIGICGAADIVVAAEDATFGLPEVDRGAMGGAAHLQRMFGVQKVRYLFFTGEMIGRARGLAPGRRRARGAPRPAARRGAGDRREDRRQEPGHDPHRQGGAHRHRGRQPGGQVPLGAGLHAAGLPEPGFGRDPPRFR
jgi:enoyl-CoA hydratase